MTGEKDFPETKVPHGRGQLCQSVLPITGARRKDRSRQMTPEAKTWNETQLGSQACCRKRQNTKSLLKQMKSARKLNKELVMLKKAQCLEYTIKPLRKTTEAEDAEQSFKEKPLKRNYRHERWTH